MDFLNCLKRDILIFYEDKYADKGPEFVEACESFIKEFFESFRKSFCNEDVKTLLNLSEKQTCEIRNIYCSCNFLENKTKNDELVNKFKTMIRRKIDIEITKKDFLLNRQGKTSIEKFKQIFGSKGTKIYSELKELGFDSFEQISKLTHSQFENKLIVGPKLVVRAVNTFYSLGFVFMDEFGFCCFDVSSGQKYNVVLQKNESLDISYENILKNGQIKEMVDYLKYLRDYLELDESQQNFDLYEFPGKVYKMRDK